MTPVFPAFAGFVPRALTAKRPEAMILRLPNWGGFPEDNCCVDLLDPLDPLFHAIGRLAIEVSCSGCTWIYGELKPRRNCHWCQTCNIQVSPEGIWTYAARW